MINVNINTSSTCLQYHKYRNKKLYQKLYFANYTVDVSYKLRLFKFEYYVVVRKHISIKEYTTK